MITARERLPRLDCYGHSPYPTLVISALGEKVIVRYQDGSGIRTAGLSCEQARNLRNWLNSWLEAE